MFTIVSERAKCSSFNYSNVSRAGLEYPDPDDCYHQLLHGRSRPRPSRFSEGHTLLRTIIPFLKLTIASTYASRNDGHSAQRSVRQFTQKKGEVKVMFIVGPRPQPTRVQWFLLRVTLEFLKQEHEI
jgi:hypothetical protein